MPLIGGDVHNYLMAASKPVVASPVGVDCDVVKEGVNGFFAITDYKS